MQALQPSEQFKNRVAKLVKKHRDIPACLEKTFKKWQENPNSGSLDLKIHEGTEYWKIRLVGKSGWRIMLEKREDRYIMFDITDHDGIYRY